MDLLQTEHVPFGVDPSAQIRQILADVYMGIKMGCGENDGAEYKTCNISSLFKVSRLLNIQCRVHDHFVGLFHLPRTSLEQ